MPSKDSKKKKKQDKAKSAPVVNQSKPQEPQAVAKDSKKRW